jgi:hypothetical protein
MPFGPYRKTLFGCFLLSSLVCLTATPASAGDLIRRDPAAAATLDARRVVAPSFLTDGVLARETVRVDPAVLAAEPDTLWLELAPGAWRLALLTDLERRDGGLVWRGRFAEDDPEYRSITLSLHEGVVLGSLQAGPLELTLRPAAGGGTSLVTVAAGAPFHCAVGGEDDPALHAAGGPAAPSGAPAPESGSAATPPLTTSGRETAAAAAGKLHFLLLYSPALAERWEARKVAVAFGHHAIDSLNTAFANSRIEHRAVLAEMREWFPRTFNGNAALLPGRASGDAQVRAARDESGADMVVILADEDSVTSCGYGLLMTKAKLGPQFADEAFSTTNVDCEGRDHRIFVHEIGHNLGGQHQPAVTTPQDPVFPYAFGYDGNVRTLMAYGTTHHLYSNPAVRIEGEQAGIEGERDVARAFDQTIPVAAAFRSGGSSLPRTNTPPPLPPPPRIIVVPPTDVTARTLSATAVELRWNDNSGSNTGNLVEAGRLGFDWEIAIETPDVERWVVEELEPATSYRFRVSAVGPDNVAPSDEVRARTHDAPPEAPAGLVAAPLSAAALSLDWGAVERASGYEVEVRTADPAAGRAGEPIALGDGGAVLGGLDAATPYTVRVRAVNGAGVSAWSAPASATTLGAGGPCAAGGETLCLLGGRFEVRARWRNPREPFGHGVAAAKPAPGSQRTGLFTFFDPDNVELVVKMLDGRAANGAFWHFYGALSDVEYWVSVRDTAEGGSRTYHNEPFALCGRGDTTAFVEPEVPAAGPLTVPSAAPVSAGAVFGPPAALAAPPPRATAAADGACVPGGEALCLAGGRFRVEVAWENPRVAGQSGTGKVFAGLDGDQSGHFWFFRPDNLELSVKILDGRALNGHFWIFWGGLSDLGYTIRVTDTETAEIHDFVNPPLTLCGDAVTDVL